MGVETIEHHRAIRVWATERASSRHRLDLLGSDYCRGRVSST